VIQRVGGQCRQQLPAYPGMQGGQQAEDGQQQQKNYGAWKSFEEDASPGTAEAGRGLPESKHEGLRHAFQAISAKNLVNPAQNGSKPGSRNSQMKKSPPQACKKTRGGG
jgi:hypothetical protein